MVSAIKRTATVSSRLLLTIITASLFIILYALIMRFSELDALIVGAVMLGLLPARRIRVAAAI